LKNKKRKRRMEEERKRVERNRKERKARAVTFVCPIKKEEKMRTITMSPFCL
jgi:hypothetical protein